LKARLRLLALIGIALLLVAVVVWRFATADGGDANAEAEADPIAGRIEQHRRNGNTAALARETSSADVKVVRLAMHALADSGLEDYSLLPIGLSGGAWHDIIIR